MRIESNLCHISENKAVVLVKGWVDNIIIGSALGEGSTAEIAEDNAITRLNQRVNSTNIIEKHSDRKKEINIPIVNKLNSNNLIDNNNIQVTEKTPTDWSKELAEIDIEIKRLEWSREDEISFLKKNYGHNNRYKITNYDELLEYLKKLKDLKQVNINTNDSRTDEDLINESNKILKELSWDHKNGRDFLMKEFNVSTRKELTRSQLITFINKLNLMRNESMGSKI